MALVRPIKDKLRLITYSATSLHCVKSVQIRSYFWSAFSYIWTEYKEIRNIFPYSVRMRENTDEKLLCIWTLFTQSQLKEYAQVFIISIQITYGHPHACDQVPTPNPILGISYHLPIGQ